MVERWRGVFGRLGSSEAVYDVDSDAFTLSDRPETVKSSLVYLISLLLGSGGWC